MVMRFISIVIAFVALGCTAASANCLTEKSFNGTIGSKGKQERGFTLSRPGAIVSVKTESMKDNLYWRVVRPNGRQVKCAIKGPGSVLTCAPSVGGRGQPAGYHKIHLANKLPRAVQYTISCDNPP
jgi:hypothetical protein